MGNLLASQPSDPDHSTLLPTSYTYDPAGHLLSIDDGTPSQKVVFLLDASGRHASQTIGSGATTTYAYLGTSDQISSECAGGVVTYSAIDAIGDRLSQGTGSSVSGYLIADLHGNIVAAVSPGSSPLYLSAYRYDPYGETVGSWSASSGLTVPWRFGGRILESDIGSGTDLYDFGARSYDPSLGAFTSFDSVSGSAQNPLTLNRYLYANANPATLVDPDGHAAHQLYDEGGHAGTAGCTTDGLGLIYTCSSVPRPNAPTPKVTLSGTTDMSDAVYSYQHPTDMGDAVWNEMNITDSNRDSAAAAAETAAGVAASRSLVDCGWNPVCDVSNAVGTSGDLYRQLEGGIGNAYSQIYGGRVNAVADTLRDKIGLKFSATVGLCAGYDRTVDVGLGQFGGLAGVCFVATTNGQVGLIGYGGSHAGYGGGAHAGFDLNALISNSGDIRDQVGPFGGGGGHVSVGPYGGDLDAQFGDNHCGQPLVANLSGGWSPGAGGETHIGGSGTTVLWQSKPSASC